MIFFDNQRKDLSTGFVENKPEKGVHLPDATKKRILNSTVRLLATAYDPKDEDSPDVYGTGVIFNVKGNDVQVLTSMHTILAWRKLTAVPADPADLLSSFQAKLTVYYGTGNLTFNSQLAANKCQSNKVTIPPLKNACKDCASTMKSPCYYDLALITCTKREFATYATQYVLGANYNFQNQVAGLIGGVTDILNNKKAHLCVQLGCGEREEKRSKVTYNTETKKIVLAGEVKQASTAASKDMTRLQLHYRVTSLMNIDSACRYNLEAEAGDPLAYAMYPHAFEASVNGGTSAPGDSGGPFYVIDRADMNKVYLLGLTTGSDMEAAEVVPTEVFYNDIITSVLPYFETLRPAKKN